jgi:hypothetical protein
MSLTTLASLYIPSLGHTRFPTNFKLGYLCLHQYHPQPHILSSTSKLHYLHPLHSKTPPTPDFPQISNLAIPDFPQISNLATPDFPQISNLATPDFTQISKWICAYINITHNLISSQIHPSFTTSTLSIPKPHPTPDFPQISDLDFGAYINVSNNLIFSQAQLFYTTSTFSVPRPPPHQISHKFQT